MEIGYIYKVTNIVNGKYYFGQTARSPFVRFKEHLKRKNKKNGFRHLYAAMDKYGNDKFTFQIVDLVESNNLIIDLDEREKWWIEVYDATNQDKGYNMDKGGKGHKHTKNAIEAIRDFNLNSMFVVKGNVETRISKDDLEKYKKDGWVPGRYMSESHIESIRKNNRERIRSPEELERHSKRMKEHWHEIFTPESRKKAVETRRKHAEERGYWTTEETLKKLRESHLGKSPSPEAIAKMLETKKKNGTLICSTTFKKGHKNPEEVLQKIHNTKIKNGTLINSGCFKKGQPRIGYNTGKICITNGKQSKFIKNEELNVYIEQGWKKGKTIKKTGYTPWNKGKKMTEEYCKKCSLSHLKNKDE